VAPPLNPGRARLAARLRAVRAAKFRSGNAFARELGWVQSRVSKIETGTQLPTEDDIRAWTRATQAGPEAETELLQLLAEARIEYVNARDVLIGDGLAGRQANLAALEAQASQIAEYQPAVIPGLVQTAAYTRELLALPGGPTSHGASQADVEALVAERIKRQDVLYQPGKRVRLVIGEGALHSPPGSRDTLRGQLDRLVALTGLATLDLRVLPLAVPMPAMPMSGFAVHDAAYVLIETLTGEQRLDQPDEVGVYAQAFDQFSCAALTGAQAADLIHQIMNGL
jgi:transcriptional regulator with XRE-family HTH domain